VSLNSTCHPERSEGYNHILRLRLRMTNMIELKPKNDI